MSPRSRRIRALVAVASLAGVLALPAVAAANAPFTGLSTPATTSPATTTSTASTAPPVTLTSSTSSGGGLSTLEEIGIAVVALGVFAAIAYVIRSDARLHAPSHELRGIDRERGTIAPRAERVKRSRARAKAARRARRARRG